MKFINIILVSIISTIILAGGCRDHHRELIPDPLEQTNRKIFNWQVSLEDGFDNKWQTAYHAVVPNLITKAAYSFVVNIGEYYNILCFLLLLDVKNVAYCVKRVLLNTTVGWFGFIDVAEKMGHPTKTCSLVTVFNKYGIGGGPYLVVPVIGPICCLGLFLEWPLFYFTYPTRFLPNSILKAYHGIPYYTTYFTMMTMYLTQYRQDMRHAMQQIKSIMPDYYSGVRAAYRQFVYAVPVDDEDSDDIYIVYDKNEFKIRKYHYQKYK